MRSIYSKLFVPALFLCCVVGTSSAVARAEQGLQSALTAVGSAMGSGFVDVSPTGYDAADSLFVAQGTASIYGALPDQTYLVQRAVDFTPNDGTCTIAPAPPAGWLSLTTFQSSMDGSGAGHFTRVAPPPGPRGFQFDVIFRVVRLNADGSLDLSQVLISNCMTVTVK